MTVAVEVRTRPLTKSDRCDRCTGAATRVARNQQEKELHFCDHHINELHEPLLAKGFMIDIETLDNRF